MTNYNTKLQPCRMVSAREVTEGSMLCLWKNNLFWFQRTHKVTAQLMSFRRKLNLSSQSSNTSNNKIANQRGFDKYRFQFPFYNLKGITYKIIFFGCQRQEPTLHNHRMIRYHLSTVQPRQHNEQWTRSKSSSLQRKETTLQWRKKTIEPQSSSAT